MVGIIIVLAIPLISNVSTNNRLASKRECVKYIISRYLRLELNVANTRDTEMLKLIAVSSQ